MTTIERMVKADWPNPQDFEFLHQPDTLGNSLPYVGYQYKAETEYLRAWKLAAEAAIRELVSDAERYRWLRECSPYRSDRTISIVRNMYQGGAYIGNSHPSGAELDQAIDACLPSNSAPEQK